MGEGVGGEGNFDSCFLVGENFLYGEFKEINKDMERFKIVFRKIGEKGN